MYYRLKTSAKANQILSDLKDKTGITPNILCRYAISLSLQQEEPLDMSVEHDNNGHELNRQVLTGRYDLLFKTLITQKENRPLSDEEYFPTYVKAHIERGVPLLEQEFNLSPSKDRFLVGLAQTAAGGRI